MDMTTTETTAAPTIRLYRAPSNFVEDNSVAYIEQVIERLTDDGHNVCDLEADLARRGVVIEDRAVTDYPDSWTGLASCDAAIAFAEARGYKVALAD